MAAFLFYNGEPYCDMGHGAFHVYNYLDLWSVTKREEDVQIAVLRINPIRYCGVVSSCKWPPRTLPFSSLTI